MMMRRHAPVIALVALALLASACREEKMSEAEKALILRAHELTPYGFNFGDAARYETFKKTRYFDNSYQLEYEFETPDDAAGAGVDTLFLSVTVTFEKNVADARMSQGAEKIGLRAGGTIGGLKMEERKDFFKYGDESSYYVLSKEGRPGGSYFVTRIGPRVYSVLIAGVNFEDGATFAELVTPKLEKFSAYKP